jgi:hypothetical protein
MQAFPFMNYIYCYSKANRLSKSPGGAIFMQQFHISLQPSIVIHQMEMMVNSWLEENWALLR